MHYMRHLTVFFAIIGVACSHAQVRIVCSAALVLEQLQESGNRRFCNRRVDDMIAERRAEYEFSINRIKGFGYMPYIAEPCIAGPSYLNDLSPFVCSSQSNDTTLQNKGVAEGDSLHRAFGQWDFDDNDFIIKMTGRYYLTDRFFIDMVELVAPFADGLIKRDIGGAYFTGCFALKAKHFKHFLDTLDFEKMEKELISIEQMLWEFVHEMERQGLLVFKLDSVHVAGRVFNDGIHTSNCYW